MATASFAMSLITEPVSKPTGVSDVKRFLRRDALACVCATLRATASTANGSHARWFPHAGASRLVTAAITFPAVAEATNTAAASSPESPPNRTNSR